MFNNDILCDMLIYDMLLCDMLICDYVEKCNVGNYLNIYI